jgi:hypothetical protein
MMMLQSAVASPAGECDKDFETIVVVVAVAAAAEGAVVGDDTLDVCNVASCPDHRSNFFRNNFVPDLAAH